MVTQKDIQEAYQYLHFLEAQFQHFDLQTASEIADKYLAQKKLEKPEIYDKNHPNYRGYIMKSETKGTASI